MSKFDKLCDGVLTEARGKVLTLYHGTSDIHAKNIKKVGLSNTVGGANWYMLADIKHDAIFHSETASGSPVVIVFEIPMGDEEGMWDGFPYLWPSEKAGKGNWYSINEPLLPSMIKKVIKISSEELSRVKAKGL